MRIRYQNGTSFEGITLLRTDEVVRVAVRGQDDAMEFTRIHGTWVSEDCEPVTMEVGMNRTTTEDYTDQDFICSPELASHLVRLLFTDSSEDLLDDQSVLRTAGTVVSRVMAN